MGCRMVPHNKYIGVANMIKKTIVSMFVILLFSAFNAEANTKYIIDNEEKGVILLSDDSKVESMKYVYKPVDYNSHGKYVKYIDIRKYDDYFKKYTKMYFGYGFDYRWFKAQSIAESNLGMSGTDERIRSSVGAQGLMQIMPGTWKEITRASTNKYMKGYSVFEAEYNIAGGIYYNYRLGVMWKVPRPFEDWMCFIFASYNAGAGNILKAQKLVDRHKDSNLWRNVAEKLNRVTGKHSKETTEYVVRIFEIKGDIDNDD